MTTTREQARIIAMQRDVANNPLIRIGAEIMQRAADGRMTAAEVPGVYAEMSRYPISSRDVQISKMRVFWRYGDRFGQNGPQWLRSWIPHRATTPTGALLSVYETLLADMRSRL